MRTAALAMTLGASDPLALLALSPGDAQVAAAVISEAASISVERTQREQHSLAEHTAAATIRNLARAMRK